MTRQIEMLPPAKFMRAFPELKGAITAIAETLNSEGLLTCEDQAARAFEKVVDLYNCRLRYPGAHSKEEVLDRIYWLVDECSRLASFQRFGRQTFLFDEAVQDALRNTEIGETRVSDLRFPYQAFFLAGAPQSDFLGAMVRPGESEVAISVILPLPGQESVLPYWSLPIRFPTDSNVRLADAVDISLNGLLGSAKELESDMDEAMAATQNFTQVEVRKVVRTSGFRLADSISLHRGRIDRALSMVAGMLAFLTAAPDDMIGREVWSNSRQPPTKKNRKEHFQRGELPVRIVSFGQDDTFRAATGANGASPRAHWRRGHFRRHRFGPAKSLVRLVWVRPTLVNPTNGPVAQASNYVVEKPK